MTNTSNPVSFTILDKEYLISCDEEEREQLHLAVEYLNKQLYELKITSKAVGVERITIMAALNIANEYIKYKKENNVYTESVGATIKRLQEKINAVLVKGKHPEV